MYPLSRRRNPEKNAKSHDFKFKKTITKKYDQFLSRKENVFFCNLCQYGEWILSEMDVFIELLCISQQKVRILVKEK